MSEKRRLQQLQVILDMKVRQAQALAKQLAKAQQTLQHHRNTMQQLMGYQQEYLSDSKFTHSPWSRQNLQAFLVQLDQVVQTQTQQLSQAEMHHQQLQQQWQTAHYQTERFAEHVRARYQHLAQQQLQKQDIESQAIAAGYTQNDVQHHGWQHNK